MTAPVSEMTTLEFLRLREIDAYRAWRDALDGLIVKQEAWEKARRAYHDELAARGRLGRSVR